MTSCFFSIEGFIITWKQLLWLHRRLFIDQSFIKRESSEILWRWIYRDNQFNWNIANCTPVFEKQNKEWNMWSIYLQKGGHEKERYKRNHRFRLWRFKSLSHLAALNLNIAEKYLSSRFKTERNPLSDRILQWEMCFYLFFFYSQMWCTVDIELYVYA